GAAEKNDWATVQRRVRPLDSPLKSQPWAQSDLRRVRRHALEYVIHEFKDLCPRPVRRPGGDSPAEGKLVEFAAAEQLPSGLLGIADIQLADVDLDGRLDIVVLRGTMLEVYSRTDGPGWRRLVELQLPAAYDRLLVADFDQDNPKQPGTEAYRQAQQHAADSGGREESPRDGTEAEPTGGAGAKACPYVDLDIVVYGQAGVDLIRNELDLLTCARSLAPVELAGPLAELKNVHAAVAADLYHDGNLDLALATQDGLRIWSNDGDMNFADITSGAQLPEAMQATALVAVDWDRDVDLDLLVVNASGKPAGYLENLRHARFRWRAFDKGFDALGGAQAVALFDGEGNGAWDLASTGETGVSLIRTDISRAGQISPKAIVPLTRSPRRGIASWDFDNDGSPDLLAWGNKTIDFFRGADDGSLAAVPPLLTGALQDIRTCRVADLDGDGDQDLAIAEADRVLLYSNDGGNGNHWLDVELRAGIVDAGGGQTGSFRADHYGLGSVIEVRSGSHVQRQIASGNTTHFGLGEVAKPDVVRVIWTTGVPQNLIGPETDLVICDEQVLTGSCPYLYTWDGEKFAYCTDLLWAAPLGLQLAEGVLAPSRSWEYLRIPGETLQPAGGQYQLRITEELWEAAYFDQVKLIAVDHPAEVDVYSNEKVGPAEIAEFKVHTVRQPIRPVAARDSSGRDILQRIRQRDGVYVKAFDRQLAFGLAEDHYVELDFGELARNGMEHEVGWAERSESHLLAQATSRRGAAGNGGTRKLVPPYTYGKSTRPRMTLFLTGWIFPSGTSMNVAISRNPKLSDPRPPSLWAPDEKGQWREVRSYMGFPGGKTKTIAVDVSDAFLSDDYRLRIATNLEIFWDEAFLTVDEQPAPMELKELSLSAADLHFRGFSQRSPGQEFGPERYDYQRVSTAPKWAPMEGNFTRYGPVDELLSETDDMHVVVGAGDELSLSFAAPAKEPPEGWTRDFLLYNVGWDKDCDLNTVYGETVEPLPFAAMSGYPYGGDESYPDSDRHRQYLRTYQTRTQDPGGFWRNIFDAANHR
ncbi:MAG TPA: CRTAC1 family protein, partial [Pirellulales bacterium]|nr:CRTAC1 family protein [Pirellulales bacterium]